MAVDGTMVFFATIALLAAGSLVDLHRVEVGSITVYTTPALRDVLEKDIIKRWKAQGDLRVEPVYVTAGEQYNRLRMSGAQPEADIFLHASPLYLSKGFEQRHMLPIQLPDGMAPNETFRSKLGTDTGLAWYAFAWSPLVEVYSPRLSETPDLATSGLRYGLAHPTLSNNGVYTVAFFEKVSPEAGQHAKGRTVVQPVNARTNILGVADGSFDVTLGYEAVAKFFQVQGADIQYDIPLVNGNRSTTPVLFSVSLVRDGPHPLEARHFIEFLFAPETQRALAAYHFRSVLHESGVQSHLPEDLPLVLFDWDDWASVEDDLPKYEVMPNAD